jgi:selenocysteine lyase/cysteine desulfurase
MKNDRREFVKSFGLIAGAAAFGGSLKGYAKDSEKNNMGNNSFDCEENFWRWVQESYTASPNLLNLNNGGTSPQPKVVQEALETYNRFCNEAPTYYMWRILDQGREPLRAKLADLAGCSPDELAINRNTTEALDNIIFGLDLNPGDEVVLTKQDYPNVINAWKQREKREGIKLVWVNLELPSEDDDYLVNKYSSAFTSKTKIVNVTHMINWIGQLIPVKKIADEAHKRNIDVVCDAAHTFAHFDYKIPELDADYYGTSLHKWLCAPFGTGMLYIKKDKIKNIWPLMSAGEPKSEDIRKFENLGTRSFAVEQAIGAAINFHNAIGSKRKYERLLFLKNYWTEKAAKIKRVKIHTSFKPEYSGALSLFSIDGMKPSEVDGFLFNKYKIHAVGIEWGNISGVRVTPHVYTTFKDLDRLVTAIEACAKQ